MSFFLFIIILEYDSFQIKNKLTFLNNNNSFQIQSIQLNQIETNPITKTITIVEMRDPNVLVFTVAVAI